jgi:hypothetical protein
MDDKKIKEMRLERRFGLLLEKSGWGVEEFSGLLGYGTQSKSSVMRWRRGKGLSSFLSMKGALLRLLESPDQVIQDSGRDFSRTSAAYLPWFDPEDVGGIKKLVDGANEVSLRDRSSRPRILGDAI